MSVGGMIVVEMQDFSAIWASIPAGLPNILHWVLTEVLGGQTTIEFHIIIIIIIIIIITIIIIIRTCKTTQF